MIAQLVQAIEAGADILALGAGLLRLCRARLAELRQADADRDIWREREALRHRCEDFFREVDDEELYPEERAELVDIAMAYSQKLPEVALAHTIAEALDGVLGSRILPMFLNRTARLSAGDPIPVPHRDWRAMAALADGERVDDNGGAAGTPLDALPHLRLAGEWAERAELTLDGNWRLWHLLPQLESGDRLACAIPNRSLAELHMERGEVAGEPVFFNARFGDGSGRQIDRCIELLETARAHDCRIVAFPELSVSEPGRLAIRGWLDGQDVVELVIAGTLHRPVAPAATGQDGDMGQGMHPVWECEAALYLRGADAPLIHRKICPAVIPDGEAMRTEHVRAAGPALSAQLSPHWLAVLLTGPDVLLPAVGDALRALPHGLIMAPALSFDMEPFRILASDLAARSRSATLVANACVSAGPESDRPGVIIGLPDQGQTVIVESGEPGSLVIATIGSLTRRPSIVSAESED